MPSRRKSQGDPPSAGLPRLHKSREDAQRLLETQIEAGATLLDRIDVGSYLPNAVDAHRGAASRWKTHNNTLLRALFSTDEVAIDFVNATLTRSDTVYDGDAKRLLNLRTGVANGISFLQGLVETLYLYEPIANDPAFKTIADERPAIVPRLEAKQARRTALLHLLYVTTEGNRLATIPPQQLGDQLGLSAEETDRVAEYLADAGYLEWVTFGHIGITHAGIVEAERLESTKHQTEDRSHPEVHHHITIQGDVIGSQIAQATTNSSQVLVASPHEVEVVGHWVTRVRAAEATLDLPEDAVRNLRAELAKLDTEIHLPAPKRSALRGSVKAVGSILTLAAGEAIAMELVKELPQILQLLSHLR